MTRELWHSFDGLHEIAHEERYLIHGEDYFAFGFLVGHYNVKEFFSGHEARNGITDEALAAMKRFDAEFSDSTLLDTITETMIDLKLMDKLEES